MNDMNYINKKSVKINLLKPTIVATCIVAILGCGSVVKNPTRPKPTPAQSESVIEVISGVLSEMIEMWNASEASVKSNQPKIGFECVESQGNVKVSFTGSQQKTKTLAGQVEPITYTLDDSQKHNHTWSSLAPGSIQAACAPDNGIQQTNLELDGLRLAYDFEQTTTIKSKAEDIETSSVGSRSLDFLLVAEKSADQLNYEVKAESLSKRVLGGDSYEFNLKNGLNKFSYNNISGLWSEKTFDGKFEANASGQTQEINFDKLFIGRSEAETCFPTSGELSGKFIFSIDSTFDYNVSFAEGKIPKLKFDGFDELVDLKILNCVN
jgi:hypothetical protein